MRHTSSTFLSPSAIAGSLLLAAACSAGGPATTATPLPAAAAPLPGDNYAIVYEMASGIYVQDTRIGSDRAALAGVDTVLAVAASRRGGRVAVAYRTADGTRVAAFDAAAGATIELPDAAGGSEYTLAWSVDGTLLGVGVGGGTSGVFILSDDGAPRSMGCSASNRFEAWRSPSQAVVHDDRNFYTVRASDCGTLSRFTKVGHPGATYAPNGTRVAYYQDRPVQRQGGGTVQVPELWIAAHDGSGAKTIADFQSRPSNHVWAPDGSKIVYEVQSRRWANTSHLVVYDVRSAAFSYIAEEKDLGVPSDFGACWAPDGRRFAHERLYSRSSGAQRYSTRQVLVRTGDAEAVVFDEVVDAAPAAVRASGGDGCRWVSDRHVLVATRNGQRLIDVDDGETYAVPSDRRVLTARVFDKVAGGSD